MRTFLLLACGCLASAAPAGWCAIPASERTVLLNLYASTDGANWNINTNWNGPPGTECTWHGVTCDATATHVTDIVLTENELSGTLPALDGLASLRRFYVMNNKLVGALPSLSELPNLQRFNARNNRLTGAIPSLTGLTNLQDFTVQINQLTGTIPSLAGLSSLQFFSPTTTSSLAQSPRWPGW